jgi:hypothetical protein
MQVGSHDEAIELIEMLRGAPGQFDVIPHHFRSIMEVWTVQLLVPFGAIWRGHADKLRGD